MSLRSFLSCAEAGAPSPNAVYLVLWVAQPDAQVNILGTLFRSADAVELFADPT
jgi:hypothetical protein